MILVDTSIWIELLARRIEPPSELELLFVTCGPIVQEVLQGLGPGTTSITVRESLLALPRLSDPLPWHLFPEAALIYSEGRRRGVTIRYSYDCLIAAIAIENDASIWHRDRDFAAISQYTRLRQVSLGTERVN